MEKSLLIWKCLLKTVDWQAVCSYRPNASAETTTADATFIRQLKEAAWLPDKKGNFHKPREITLENLDERFIYNGKRSCIEALGIGVDAKEQENQRKQEEILRKEQDKQARGEGFASQNEKELCIELAKEARPGSQRRGDNGKGIS